MGAGHSWSSVACTDDFMVNLDNYAKVIDIDRDKKQITVQAGIRLEALNKILENNGLALINLGSIAKQSIAGATATGTHGTGINFGIISTQIIRIRLIKGDGSVLEIDDTTTNDLLNMAKVSFGAFGIISEVTLQCTEKFNLEENAAPMLFNEAMEQLPQLLQSTDHLKLWWFPHVEYLQVYRYNRVQKPLQPYPKLEAWFNESFMAKTFFTFLLRLGVLFPGWIPSINRLIKKLHFKTINRVDVSHKVFQVPMPPKHRESEYAIPVEKTAELLSALKDAIERHRLHINFVVEVRFVKGDEIPLSPAYQRDSCYVGAYRYGAKFWQEYLNIFEELMKKYNGRPHWGKEFTIDAVRLKELYPKFKDFNTFRKELDPKGIFSNPFLKKVFGD